MKRMPRYDNPMFKSIRNRHAKKLIRDIERMAERIAGEEAAKGGKDTDVIRRVNEELFSRDIVTDQDLVKIVSEAALAGARFELEQKKP